MLLSRFRIRIRENQAIRRICAQRRGGRGKQAAPTKEDDLSINVCRKYPRLYLCFSSRGRVYWLKYKVPQGVVLSVNPL